MIKVLKVICIILFFSFFIAILIGRNKAKYYNYNDFIENIYYYSESRASVYQTFHRIENVLIDDSKVESVEDLIKQSQYVLKVKVSDNPILYGKGLINQVQVLEVIKQDDNVISVGQNIKIYDLVSWIGNDFIEYYDGMTPLNLNNQYIVFIKESPSPNLKGVYMFSSIQFGHFNISNSNVNILTNYTRGTLTLKEIMQYDYVVTNCMSEKEICDSFITKYSKFQKQLKKLYNE